MLTDFKILKWEFYFNISQFLYFTSYLQKHTTNAVFTAVTFSDRKPRSHLRSYEFTSGDKKREGEIIHIYKCKYYDHLDFDNACRPKQLFKVPNNEFINRVVRTWQ